MRGEQKPSDCLKFNKQLANKVSEKFGGHKRKNIAILLKKNNNPCASVSLLVLLHLHYLYSCRKENKTHDKFKLCGSKTAQCTSTSG